MFESRSASVPLNCFHPSAINYQPNAWNIIKDLKINIARISGGIEGDKHHINMRYTDWAQNLDAFLSEADIHGIKIYFVTMGMPAGTLLGIVCPEPYRGVAGTPLADAKGMVNQLAGDNALGHNFITDPRIFAWSLSNEVDISNSETLNWCMAMADYIRGKGGKVFLECPINRAAGGTHLNQMDFHNTEPLIRGHVDYLCMHIYHVLYAASAQIEGRDVYHAMYDDAFPTIKYNMVEGRGMTPIENLILGEFGIWKGDAGASGGVMGVPAGTVITDETRAEYYRAIFDAARDNGIRHVSFYDSFAQKALGEYQIPMWSVVDVDGSYFPLVSNIIKTAYTPISPMFPIAVPLTAGLILMGLSLVKRRG